MSEQSMQTYGGITDVCIVHGWTLIPDNPAWYRDTGRFLEQYYGVDVTIPAMPDTDSPRRDAWIDALDTAITSNPEKTLVVGHSLGFMTSLHWGS